MTLLDQRSKHTQAWDEALDEGLERDRYAENQAAAPEGEGAARTLVSYSEEYRCPLCESLLPAECVKREPPTQQQLRAGQRTIGVYCPHCNQGFEGLLNLRDGLLVPVAVTHLDDPEARPIREQYEKYHGITRTSTRSARSVQARPSVEEAARLARERAELRQRIASTQAQLDGMRAAERSLGREETGAMHGPPGCPPPAEVTAFQERAPAREVPTAEQIAAQMADLDREFDQRTAYTESEPGRDYVE